VHISEISWERVENPSDYVKVGDEVEAKIIAIDKERLSLSVKQMQEDPWATEAASFKKGDKVEGTVTRITPFGAFIQISPSVEALVHVSELGEGEANDPEKLFKLNEKKNFTILEIDRDNRKISLSLQ
jgi:ribosomal protein S1